MERDPRRMGPPIIVPAVDESTPYPEPIPKWRAEQEGTRWCKVTLGEWHEVQAKRRAALAQGATLMSLQFLADQVMTTSQSLALFAGLAARIIWLRKQRRRRGEPRDGGGQRRGNERRILFRHVLPLVQHVLWSRFLGPHDRARACIVDDVAVIALAAPAHRLCAEHCALHPRLVL